MDKIAGSFPGVSGLTVSHPVFVPVIATEYAGVPELALMESF